MSRRRKLSIPGTEVELPITPMLDMAFQLLAFFVFTFNPSNLQEGAIDLNLPAVGEAKAPKPEDVKPSESDLELPKDVDVTVKITTPNGQPGDINQIIVEYRLTAETVTIDGDNTAQKVEKLRKVLTEKRPSLQNKDDIKIEADGRLRNEPLMQVVDACTLKGAGFQKVSFGPPFTS
jgi:biopolymer transport protein ExbD